MSNAPSGSSQPRPPLPAFCWSATRSAQPTRMNQTCVGDAIPLFLTVEDIQTFGMCLLNIDQIDEAFRYPSTAWQPWQYLFSRARWASTISNHRWLSGIAILIVAISPVEILYAIADNIGFWVMGFDTSARGLWKIGFGQIDSEILIGSDSFGTPVTFVTNS